MNNRYIKTIATCAGPNCKAVRGEANHWFLVVADISLFQVLRWTDEAATASDKVLPVCGEACVQKLLSQFTGLFTKGKVKA